MKVRLLREFGGACEDCGYSGHLNALEFHHRDPATKEFTISRYITQMSFPELVAEATKCALVCANCHRVRHASVEADKKTITVTDARRAVKLRAIAWMGGRCECCERPGPSAVFEFHHRDSATKEFGIGDGGTARTWATIVRELAKCALLCANCHREVHAGARELDDGLLGLAEARTEYAA